RGDREFCGERDCGAAGPRECRGVADRRIAERVADERGDQEYSAQPANDLRYHEEKRVPRTNLAEPQEGQSDRRVHMRPGTLAPAGMNERDRGDSHGNSPSGLAPHWRGESTMYWRGGRTEQRGDEPGANHERTERPALDEILGPMFA